MGGSGALRAPPPSAQGGDARGGAGGGLLTSTRSLHTAAPARRATMASRNCSIGPVQAALRAASNCACELKIIPSASTLRWLARERRAGGRDVDDQFGGPAGGRALRWRRRSRPSGSLQTPWLGEEAARQVHIFGRDAQPPPMLAAELRGDSSRSAMSQRRSSIPAPRPPRRRDRSRAGAGTRRVPSASGMSRGSGPRR